MTVTDPAEAPLTHAQLVRRLEENIRRQEALAHELRTPLNTLSLQTQMRKRRLAAGNAQPFTMEEMRAMVERDERQIQSMVRLLDDMLRANSASKG